MQSLIPKLVRVFPQSLIAEIHKLLGSELTEKFLMVFAGTTLKIPSTRDMQEAQRNISIYETIRLAKDKKEAIRLRAILAERYDLSVKEVRYVNRQVYRLMKEAHVLRQADVITGQHQKSGVKVRRKKKRRM